MGKEASGTVRSSEERSSETTHTMERYSQSCINNLNAKNITKARAKNGSVME
jgi:hypothetical protein